MCNEKDQVQASDGKQRFNAFKHGMFARHLLVPGDDAAELHQFKIGMIQSLNPADSFQQIIAERIICAAWKLRRMEQAEQELYHAEMNDPQNPAKTPGAAMVRMMKQGQPGMLSEIERIQKYQQKLEGTMTRNMHLLHKLRTEGWHFHGVISELAGKLIKEEEAALRKIDPQFKAESSKVDIAQQSDGGGEQCPPDNAVQERPTEPKAASWSPITNAELSDYLGKCAESWNKVDVDDLRQRAKKKSTNQLESTRIGS